jgi:hypothetical protein
LQFNNQAVLRSVGNRALQARHWVSPPDSESDPEPVVLPRDSRNPGRKIIMASPALKDPDFQRADFQPLDPSITTDFHSPANMSSSLDQAPFLNSQTIATAEGLKGARAAMVALVLELSAALFLYGIWYAWHSLR